MVNLYVKPKRVEYVLAYSDGKGERLRVQYASDTNVIINSADTTDIMLIDKTDLEWLISVLQEVKKLHAENDK